MPYTYPPAAPTVSGDVTSIHRLLKEPTLIERRLRTIAEQRFIADALLTGRFTAEGGAIQYEQGESLYTDRTPEAIRPGMNYPMAGLGIGPTQIAEVQKWGQDVPVTDESIKRLKRNPVDRAFLKLVNQMVKQVDGISIAAIVSAVTQTAAAAAVWSSATAKQIFLDVAKAKAAVIDLNEGFEPDTVVVSTTAWTYAMATFADAGYLPREDRSAPVFTGQFPVIEGMRWLATPSTPVANAALLVDSTQLGGMADEQLGGPGYAGSVAGIETKSIRDEDNDGYKLRARRVTVPVVLEPNAGYVITGVTS
ncbi:hypothetical protein Psed_5790 [Pseudonocardia dioxanivorans CB1190]|uniref:Major capsid protein n=1 Tax=Pseudonocardia dioxanivorans (strain ATCC 55486 / DSM 44775 / JCM 13855 / CB1190) TaxID=675635 RepID=F4D1C9_PSEUX|nr:hypothetical protein [Pseudonocardia dioxanivorans]AEA27917.1 hypothetical protein Psed_5790 [Pseudonocardia dioxanivorans CB1190]